MLMETNAHKPRHSGPLDAATKQMHMNLSILGRDFARKQYFDHCATISSRILTGSRWEDSQRNLGLNCLLGFVLMALVLLNNS
jgi:hypothetical protein